MAVEILNFENSFVQFCQTEPESCADYNGVILPIKYLGDIGICFELSAANLTEAGDVTCAISKQSFAAAATIDTGAAYIVVGSVGGGTGAYGDNYIKIIWDDDCMELDLGTNGAVVGECLYLVLYFASTNEVLCTSNQIFTYVDDVCFTEVVLYRSDDDVFDFPYETLDSVFGQTYYNRIRLYLDLTSPKPLTKKTGFELSDGSFRTLGVRKQKEWSIETNYMTDHLHQCLDAAIDHDYVYLTQVPFAVCNDYSDYEFYHDQDDKYDIDWQEGPGNHLGVAKAKFKLKTNPYYSQNSNC